MNHLKSPVFRSRALLNLFRLIPCQHCGRDDGTVCAAHSNWGVHGKAGALKADDRRCASLCSLCHVPLLDQGTQLSRIERLALWWTAHIKSVSLLVHRGLWIADVPVPDLALPEEVAAAVPALQLKTTPTWEDPFQ